MILIKRRYYIMAREDENQQFGEIAGVQRVVDEFKKEN